jgi:prophage DNA circulation protein
MGRAQRTINITAFVVGDDYEYQRDALIEALEEPGPGTLIHPWLGEFYVNLIASAEVTHNATAGRYVQFKLQFVEAREPESPGYSIFWLDLALLAGLAARVAVGLSLTANFLLSPVSEAAMQVAHSWALGLSSVLGAVYRTIVAFPLITDAIAVFSARVHKVGGIAAMMMDFWPRRNYQREGLRALAYQEAVGLLNLSLSSKNLEIPSFLGTVRREVATNRAAVQVFQREMSGIAGLEAVASALPKSATEAKKLRELTIDATDNLLNNASSDEVFRQIQKLSVAAQKALAEAAKQAPDVVVINPLMEFPALALAWRYILVNSKKTEPVELVNDLVSRNNVRHPGFMPAGALEALLV